MPKTAHGWCLLWDQWTVWPIVIGDVLIFLSYLVIAAVLLWLYVTQPILFDARLRWGFMSFGLFIVACGFTHLTSSLTMFEPWYGWHRAAIIVCAVVSVPTAVAIIPIVRSVLADVSYHDTGKEFMHRFCDVHSVAGVASAMSDRDIAAAVRTMASEYFERKAQHG